MPPAPRALYITQDLYARYITQDLYARYITHAPRAPPSQANQKHEQTIENVALRYGRRDKKSLFDKRGWLI